MEKTEDELNKHFWHRLYKVILWLGSASISLFIEILISPQKFWSFIMGFVAFSYLSFLIFFIIYRLILYIAIGGKLFFDKKDKWLFLKMLLGLAIIVSVIFVMADYDNRKRQETQKTENELLMQQKSECKKNLLKEYFDPNMNIKDIYCCYVTGEKKDVLIDAIAFFTGKTTESIEFLIQQEWTRVANKRGRLQLTPLKLKDVVGDINLNAFDYRNPSFLPSYYNGSSF